MTPRLARAASVVALLLCARVASAQEHPVTRPELRLDATSARVSRLEGSLGVVVPAGIYARILLDVGGGVARVSGATRNAARADAIARFELDPLLQRQHSVYVGGGVSYLATAGERGRGYLAVVAGWELKTRHGWVPNIEIGMGGGARVALAFRRAMENWR